MIVTTVIVKALSRGGEGALKKVFLSGTLLFLTGSLGLAAQGTGSGGYFVPGDAKAGLKVFFDRGCSQCHSVLGEGGKSAPDLARAPGGHLSAGGLVSAVWNHAPAMWERHVGHVGEMDKTKVPPLISLKKK
jgi:mono/diheme cytochrome c family protein